MPYKVKDPNVLQDLHPGDHMTGVLLVDDAHSYLDQIVITSQAKPDYKPPVQYHVPAVGDAVPDFRFVNQSGQNTFAAAVSRQDAADHVHLHTLSAVGLLPAHEPQFCADR